LEANPAIDESNARAVIRRYHKHWKQRLAAENIALSPIPQLIKSCHFRFKRQFMQIKATKNQLYLKPT
jgi:hypothetical protein